MTDTTPGTDVAYLHSSLQERKEYAAALAAAGELVPSGFRDRNGAANPAKLLLAFETGVMLGLHPLAALQGIHVIEGKPTISAQLMSGIVRSKGHKLRVSSKGSIEGNDYEVTATLIRVDDPSAPFTATWTLERARRAELFGKGNWRKYPEAMLQARAISEVARIGAPDALAGLVYTPEELGATVNEDGDVIDGEIVDEDVEALAQEKLRQYKQRMAEKNPEPDREPGHTGKRGHASETRVTSGPDAHATRSGGSRPSPSRTVETSGAGRAPKAEEPSEETRAAVADYVERIAAEDDIERLRDLHGDASTHGLLATPTADGRRLNDVFYQRREAILQAQEMPPALDGIEDDA